ncbi:MAG: hypothetical protein A2X67_07375 [Ignavibacteria bacterium GWA2_55_11]|nr:MAG: hypothetical protein A2X67_07375 [Ignavibacteria bacterium GWA2_55_11]
MSRNIRLLNATGLEKSSLESITVRVARALHCDVRLESYRPDLTRVLDPTRGQYHSGGLLKEMQDRFNGRGEPNERFAALVDVDLFIPVLTFVFGEAQLDGKYAVISTYRLKNEFYGIPADPGRLLERFEKEIVHEAGHVFGLLHCRNFECVMRSSTYVEEIDLKQDSLCGECEGILRGKTE